MAEFSAHRASAASDSDVPWTFIKVTIRTGPAFDSGSCSEQRRGSWSLLLELGPGTGFDNALSVSELGAVSVN